MTDSNEEEWEDMYLDDVGVHKRQEQCTPSRLADACLVALRSQRASVAKETSSSLSPQTRRAGTYCSRYGVVCCSHADPLLSPHKSRCELSLVPLQHSPVSREYVGLPGMPASFCPSLILFKL